MAVYKDDANLMGLWSLDEASGTRLDYTPNNNDLTDNNTVGQNAVDYKEGVACADFESGNSEYLSITDAAQTGLDITGSISLGCWFKPESLAAIARLITKWNTTGNLRCYQFHVDGSGYVYLYLSSDGTAYVICYTGAVVSVGAWIHLAAVYNGTDIRIYVNGVLSNNGSFNPLTYSSGIADKASTFYIGTRADLSSYADGLGDEAFVFNRALSAAEVLDIYNNKIQDPSVGQPMQLRGWAVPGMRRWRG